LGETDKKFLSENLLASFSNSVSFFSFQQENMEQFEWEVTSLFPDNEETTTLPSSTTTTSATLQLYDIFIPLLGIFIISLNLLVVVSSGLLMKKRKLPPL